MNPVDLANIISFIALVMGVIGGYVKLMTKIKELDMKILQMEGRLITAEKHDDRILDKLDSIAEDISDIKIEMQNKLDRD